MPTNAGLNNESQTGYSSYTKGILELPKISEETLEEFTKQMNDESNKIPAIALKPCPFCGSRDVKLRHYKANGDDWWYVTCTNCRIAIDPMMWNDHVSKEEAMEIWNRRVKE